MASVASCAARCIAENWDKDEHIYSAILAERFEDFEALQTFQTIGNGALCVVRDCLMEATNSFCTVSDSKQLSEDYRLNYSGSNICINVLEGVFLAGIAGLILYDGYQLASRAWAHYHPRIPQNNSMV